MLIQVVGQIWQPGMGLCTYSYSPGSSQLQPALNKKYLSRKDVDEWLKKHAGDFSQVEDYCVINNDKVVFPWKEPKNEAIYADSMR